MDAGASPPQAGATSRKEIPATHENSPAVSRRLRALIPLSALILAFVLAFTAVHHRHLLQVWLIEAGPLGPLVSIAIYVGLVSSPFVSSDILALLNGAIFGFWEGAAINCAGVMLGGVSTYLIARRAGEFLDIHEDLERLPPWVKRLPVGSPLFLLALRVVPWVGGTIANNVAGFYKIAILRHLWTTAVVALPVAIFTAYAGWRAVGLLR
ncbi:TVP38/TMEM64 family protein [bacterium]|nr:MAG: TVP38/TMEM64 family protein [bacterium]